MLAISRASPGRPAGIPSRSTVRGSTSSVPNLGPTAGAANLLGRFVRTVLVLVPGDADVEARLGELDRCRLADPRVGACDDRDSCHDAPDTLDRDGKTRLEGA